MSVYLLTLAPSLTWAHWGADGGDFVAAAVTGRIPHPPGFPVYMALARLFVRSPWGNPAWRLNLLSAVMAAGTVGLMAATLLRWRVSRWAALSAALSLAFAPLFWSQALITEVFTTAAFFVTLWLYTQAGARLHRRGEEMKGADGSEDLTPGCESPKTVRWTGYFVIGLVLGLGCAVHLTLLFLLPVLWVSLFKPNPSFLPVPLRLLAIILLLIGFGVGLLPYALLPLSGPWPQPWGDMRTLHGWWHVVSGQMYWGYAFALPLSHCPSRLLAWAALLARQFTPVGALLAGGGAIWLWRRNRTAVVGAFGAFGLLSVYAIGYDTPDSLVYLTSGLPLLALLVGLGLDEGIRHGLPRWAGLGLPLALLLWNWGTLDLHADHTADLWLESELAKTPPDTVLLTRGDQATFTLWYAQAALGLRPDVVVVNENLWQWGTYRAFLRAQTGVDAQYPQDFARKHP